MWQSHFRTGIDARILRAICFIESRYRINVIGPKGARAPMQFMPGTAGSHIPINSTKYSRLALDEISDDMNALWLSGRNSTMNSLFVPNTSATSREWEIA
jgi:hypothetical protein